MKWHKRVLCLVFAALLLVSLAPGRAAAAESVCFLAANEKLLPLNDETMPFWSGGSFYVPHTLLDGGELGVHYSRNTEKLLFTAYNLNSGSITFDLAAGTIETNTLKTIAGSAIVRGGIVFLPLGVLCSFFSLDYIYTRVTYGYLLRVKTPSDTFSNERFIDAASTPMAQRYAQYEKAHAPVDNPSNKQDGDKRTQETPQPRTVYLAVEATADAAMQPFLDASFAGSVAYLFAPQTISASGALLRRLSSSGYAVALRIDASGGAEAALEQIVHCNQMLWEAASFKTRLVALSGADEEAERAVAEAGYCPLHFALDYGEGLPSVSRTSSRIFSAADANHGSCCVFLGTDEAVSGVLSTLITSLRAGNCTIAQLNETAA